jgi:hypothetical protein
VVVVQIKKKGTCFFPCPRMTHGSHILHIFPVDLRPRTGAMYVLNERKRKTATAQDGA